MSEPKMPTPEEISRLNEDRIKTNKEFIVGGAELSDNDEIIATDEQINKSSELMETILKSKNRISEIHDELKKMKSSGDYSLDIKSLSLEFHELWKFLDKENELNGDILDDIEEVRVKLLELKDDSRY